MKTNRRAAAEYLRFLSGAIGATFLVALLGLMPTRAAKGQEGVTALLVGCGLTLTAAAIAAIPLSRALVRADSQARLLGLVFSMAFRFGAVLLGVLVMLLGGWFHRNTLLLGVAFSYVAVLAIETKFAIAAIPR